MSKKLYCNRCNNNVRTFDEDNPLDFICDCSSTSAVVKNISFPDCWELRK